MEPFWNHLVYQMETSGKNCKNPPIPSGFCHNSLQLCVELHGLLFLISCKPRLKFIFCSGLRHSLFQGCKDTPCQFLFAKIRNRCNINLTHHAFTVLICQNVSQVILYRKFASYRILLYNTDAAGSYQKIQRSCTNGK